MVRLDSYYIMAKARHNNPNYKPTYQMSCSFQMMTLLEKDRLIFKDWTVLGGEEDRDSALYEFTGDLDVEWFRDIRKRLGAVEVECRHNFPKEVGGSILKCSNCGVAVGILPTGRLAKGIRRIWFRRRKDVV